MNDLSLMASQEAMLKPRPAGSLDNKKAMSRMVSSPAHGLSSQVAASNALHIPPRSAASKTDIDGSHQHIHL
jgi:hypothetical protein